jgi:ketosteroid isomerase-like protein
MLQEKADSVRGTRVAPARLSERARKRRSPDERLCVWFPSLYSRLSAALLSMPPRFPLRRLMVARSIARSYAAANRRDFELILTFNDDAAYEYHPSPDLLPPDMDTVYRGHDGYRRFWRLWLDAFQDIRWEPEEILDFGDKLLVTTAQSGRGSSSGIAVSEPVFQLFTLRRGLVVRQQDFLDRDEALEAVSLDFSDKG